MSFQLTFETFPGHVSRESNGGIEKGLHEFWLFSMKMQTADKQSFVRSYPSNEGFQTSPF